MTTVRLNLVDPHELIVEFDHPEQVDSVYLMREWDESERKKSDRLVEGWVALKSFDVVFPKITIDLKTFCYTLMAKFRLLVQEQGGKEFYSESVWANKKYDFDKMLIIDKISHYRDKIAAFNEKIKKHDAIGKMYRKNNCTVAAKGHEDVCDSYHRATIFYQEAVKEMQATGKTVIKTTQLLEAIRDAEELENKCKETDKVEPEPPPPVWMENDRWGGEGDYIIHATKWGGQNRHFPILAIFKQAKRISFTIPWKTKNLTAATHPMAEVRDWRPVGDWLFDKIVGGYTGLLYLRYDGDGKGINFEIPLFPGATKQEEREEVERSSEEHSHHHSEKRPDRMELIMRAVEVYDGRLTARGYPWLRALRKQSGIKSITSSERNTACRRLNQEKRRGL